MGECPASHAAPPAASRRPLQVPRPATIALWSGDMWVARRPLRAAGRHGAAAVAGVGGAGGAQVTGLVIWGSLVWKRGWRVAALVSSVMVARSLVAGAAAMVLSLVPTEIGVREEEEEEGVRRVEAGESLFSEGGLGRRRRSQPCRSA